jgi:hypothetical protein
VPIREEGRVGAEGETGRRVASGLYFGGEEGRETEWREVIFSEEELRE